MDNVIFLTFRTYFIAMMTVGMMASLTEFRFGWRKLLGISVLYSIWVILSSVVLLYVGGELLLLRLFLFTISAPATFLTYWAANDTPPTQAVFNYMTQILLSVVAASAIRVLSAYFGISLVMNILLMGAFYLSVIGLEWHFLRRPFRMMIRVLPAHWGVLTLIPCVFCGYLIFVASWPEPGGSDAG